LLRLIAIGLAGLLLAACAAAPVIVYVTPAPAGPLDYLSAGEIVRVATVTAAAQATDSARATAERLVTQQALADARDAATLSAAQTQSALNVALQAGQATQAAQGTAAVQTQAAGQTQAWATPTWAALRTQAAAERSGIAASATAISQASERAQAGVDGYRGLWGALVAVATVAALVAGAIAVYFYFQREDARLATLRQAEAEKADRERLETDRAAVELERARLELLKSMMIERDGPPWVISPGGRLVPMLPGGLAAVSQPNLAHDWRWRAAIKKTVFCGIAKTAEKGSPQFGERDLAGREPESCWVTGPDGRPSSTGYRQVAGILRKMGIWITSGRDTVFAPEWNAERFEREFDHLPLPELPAGEPPSVRIPPRDPAVTAIAAVNTVPQTSR